MFRKTKIVCTIGPASRGVENLTRLITAGMDVARINFSHGTPDEHRQAIQDIRAAAEITQKNIGILQDLQGPKIRTGKVDNDAVELHNGAQFIITTRPLPCGDGNRVSTTYENLTSDVHEGGQILLDDGYIILQVEKVEGPDIVTRVVKGGLLKNNKGIIVPNASISAPALSTKDIEDLRFGLAEGVDAVALSFVRSHNDILELGGMMKALGRVVPIIAKIERREGIADITQIIGEASGIMVARGDLGVELPLEDVPIHQKKIIEACNYYGKPVIIATQMLESMLSNPRPTRAEVSDVANAVLDGADCVMLSAETSVGSFPTEAVGYMDRIIRKVECGNFQYKSQYEIPENVNRNVPDAIGRAACVIAEQIHAAAIVSLTSSGGTAKLIAKYRPSIPILALTDDEHTLRRMSFVWGVYARLIPPLVETEALFPSIADVIIESGVAKKGDYVVYSAGTPLQHRLTTNTLKVQKL